MSLMRRLQGLPVVQPRRFPWRAFLILSVVFYLTYHDISRGPVDGYNRPEDEIVTSVSTGSALRQVALIALTVLAVGSLVAHPQNRRLRYEGPLGPLLLGFLGWAFLSLLWADDFSQTSKRLVAFAMLCTTAVAIVRRFSLRQIVMWTFFCTALYLLLGIAAELAYGTLRPFSSGYRFGGTLHPNGEGIECSLLVLSAIAAAQIEKKHWRIFSAGALLGFGFLYLTGSRTSLIATLLGALVYIVAASSKRVKIALLSGISVFASLLALLAGVGALSGLQNALVLGREDVAGQDVSSFTGRTTIWEDVTPYIRQSPIIGHGYSGFWTPEHISAVSDEEKWGVPDSHSAYVDYVLTLGIVGLVLYSLCLLVALWRAVVMCRIKPDPSIAFLIGFLVFCLVDGMLESAIGEGSLLTLLCAVALVWLASVPLEEVWQLSATNETRRNDEVCLA